MNPDPKRVEAIFAAVLVQTPAARTAYLAEACAGDQALCQRVEALLKAHDEAGNFLANPLLERAGHASAMPDAPGQTIAEAPTLGIASTPTNEPTLGTKVRYVGDYELGPEIARGGMGVVYQAKQVSLNRTVALKMILAGQLASDADVQRFHREAEAAANLDHPNIVPIYEIGEHEGQHYFSMKLIEKGSLAHAENNWQSKRGSMDQQKRMAVVMAAVARAVHHAHQRGILHRDLKPGNILIDALGQPQVTDFGLAKRLDLSAGLKAEPTHTGGAMTTATATRFQAAVTHAGAIMGTPSYMAPEQARGEAMLTTAVDVYALGAILYELLTGRPPFRAGTPLDTVIEVLEREPEPPRKVNRLVDRDLEAICLKCLQKEITKRYASAAAVAEDLDHWLAGQPIQARPIGPVKKVFKWAKRNPTLAVLLMVLPLWYFNVRLPWEWAWLEWVGYGVLALLGLSTLVVVCGRAIGKYRDIPLDLVRDGFLLPGVVLALFVLFFYPGDLADRKSLAGSIVLTSFMWGYVIQWLWRRKQAGPLSLALRSNLKHVIVIGLLLGLLTVYEFYGLIHVSEQTEDLLVNVCSRIQSLSLYIFSFLLVAVGIEIRKQACVTFFRFVRWEEIESYAWRHTKTKDPDDSLFLRLNLHHNPLLLDKHVHPAKKEMVDRILLEHVPHSGQDVTPQGVQDSTTTGDSP